MLKMALQMLFEATLIGLIVASTAATSAFLSLDSNTEWRVTNSNSSINIPAVVPGGIYTDLMRSGIIGDPYFRKNDVIYKWVGYENWTYSRVFTVTEQLLQKERVTLVCHGLDTVSEIIVNGHQVSNTNNMFVRYVIDIKDKLQVGENNIEVRFQSAVLYSKQQRLKHLKEYNYGEPPSCPLPPQNGECNVNFIRKVQSSFSWDWGPSFPSQGIWKKIGIEAYDSVLIRDITVNTNLENNQWNLELHVFFERTNVSKAGVLQMLLENKILLQRNLTFTKQTPQETSVNVQVQVPKTMPIDLWWPNGYGAQKLYNLSVSYIDMQTSEVSTISKRIGFRTIELVQDNITQSNVNGQSFYFRINGVPIFAKGSNLIPLDSFLERVTPEKIRWLLESAVAANMNILRVWGGGMYETEELYQTADSLGILLWQDFVFACAYYPADDSFLQTVSVEVTQQVRRLQSHPSLCLWSGNNENELTLSETLWLLEVLSVGRSLQNILRGGKGVQYRNDYVKLYTETIYSLVQKEDPTRPFLTSSPTNALPSEARGMIDKKPNNELYGDVHFYKYFGDSWNWKTYPTPRFASEYGFQSYPSFHTLATVSQPSDWTFPKSEFLTHRQHHILGSMALKSQMKRQFFLPASSGVKGFQDFLYLTQVTQVMGVKTETEHYRRSRSDLVYGKGHTMGALYWQLNDIWQGASWASIDFFGNWKMLHYFARDFFAPTLVSPYIDGNDVKVSVVSDLTHPVNLTLSVSVYDWSSFSPKYQTSLSFLQPPQLAKIVYQISVNDLMTSAACQRRQKSCFFYFRLTDTKSQVIFSENFVFSTKLNRAVGLKKANIQIDNITQVDNRLFQIRLKSDRIAPFVWLEANNILGTFSRNGFLMIEPTVSLVFNSTRNVSLVDLKANLTVQSLMDTQDGKSLIRTLVSHIGNLL